MREGRKTAAGRRTLPSNTPPIRKVDKISAMLPFHTGYVSAWRGAGHILRLGAVRSNPHEDMEKQRRRPGRPHDHDTTLSVDPDMSRKTPFGTNPVGILSRTARSHVWPQAPPLESSALGCFHEVQSEMQWTNCRSIICPRSRSQRFALNSGNRTRRVNLPPQSLESSSQDPRDGWCPQGHF